MSLSARFRRAITVVGGGALALATAACGTGGRSSAPAARPPVAVVFLADTARTGMGPEAAAAWTWLSAQETLSARYVQLADLADTRLDPGAVLWWHDAENLVMPSSALAQETTDAVRTHLAAGGGLMVSLFATPWLVPLGIESTAPDRLELRAGAEWARWGPQDDRILSGFQTYRGHPLLRRFWGGTFTASLQPDRRYPSAGWTGQTWPDEGRVVAVARRAIALDPDRRVVVEYPPGGGRRGRVLAVGEGLYFDDADNANRTHLEHFVGDALAYLAGITPPAPAGARVAADGALALPADTTASELDTALPAPPTSPTPQAPTSRDRQDLPGVLGAVTYWTRHTSSTRWIESTREADGPLVPTPVPLEAVVAARSGLSLERESARGDFFDLSSPRNLLTGRDRGRVEELWGYPVRVLRDLRFGKVDADGTTEWLDEAPDVRFTARPEGDSFRYTFENAVIDLHLTVPRDRVGLLAVIAVDASGPVRLRAAWEVDNAVMWPREKDHLGDLQLGYAQDEQAVLWRDRQGIMRAYAGFGIEPAQGDLGGRPLPAAEADGTEVTAPREGLTRKVWLDVEVPAGDGVAVSFVVAARADDRANARADYRAALANPAATWTANANYWREFLAQTVAIASPDPTINEAFHWAKVGLEAFRTTTPGMGTGLVAGFASAKRAADDPWAADHDFLRRPGYAWYFGRDAIWSAFAADAYGGSDLAEQTLRLLARYQDVDGKILHELAPDWIAHYDAADSTPLFLLGLDDHVRTTGNRDLLRELWPSVRRAMEFLEATDTDGDGLIENTNVGHGWIEGGKFYGAHTTLYLAGIWAATLEAVARMAEWVGDDDLAQDAAGRVEVARAAINEGFWDPLERAYRYGKRRDGTYLPYRTILPAVPALLGVTDLDKTRPMVRMFGSAEITSDWGARMAPRSNPDYDPAGYHQGSVWPLYTGWTSLAAYRARQPLTGFLHAYSNLRLVRQGSLGHIPEVLDGEVMESIGVTDHQAWSHALSVLPILRGLLGIRPDAINGVLQIWPQLPGGWQELTAQRVRVGDNAFNITVRRGFESSGFVIERVAGNEAIQFDLALPYPRAALVNLDHDNTSGVAIPDGESILDLPTEKQTRVKATLTANRGVVTFRHSPFPEVIQPLPAPQPGTHSEAMRIVETRFTAGSLNVRVEGIPGHTYRFSVATPWPVRNVAGPRGSSVLAPGPGRALVEVRIPGSAAGYHRADLTLEFGR